MRDGSSSSREAGDQGGSPLGPARIKRLPSGHCLLTVSGDIDLAQAPELVAELEYAVQRVSPYVVLDLEWVDFVDSSGLAALIRARDQAMAAGGDLQLAGTTAHIRELLRITRLDDVFAIYPSVDAATTIPVPGRERPTRADDRADDGLATEGLIALRALVEEFREEDG
ncbi:MAG: STAS domain-containing protein [Nocardioides sp.]